jgi:hypothetical protein
MVYQKSYPNYFDTIPYPRGFRVLEFMKFTGRRYPDEVQAWRAISSIGQ